MVESNYTENSITELEELGILLTNANYDDLTFQTMDVIRQALFGAGMPQQYADLFTTTVHIDVNVELSDEQADRFFKAVYKCIYGFILQLQARDYSYESMVNLASNLNITLES